MFRKRRSADLDGSNLGTSQSKKQRVTGVMKILLDITKESADSFPPLKSVLNGVTALIKHYEEFKDVKEKIEDLGPQLIRLGQAITTTTIDVDPEEERRRTQLTSALEKIARRSQELLEKGAAARFVDKAGDSAEVVKLVERFREAITHYQISQQQSIYDRITNLTSSFNTIINLHEKYPAVKNKLDSIIARLGRLRSEDDAPWDEDERERRAKLFETLRSIGDNGSALYNRVSVQEYKECQDDILAVSGLAEDVRDALLEYQMIQQRTIFDQSCKLIDTVHLSILNSCRRARGAGYQHGNRRGCLRGTRETVLSKIESWTNDFDESPVFWLNGLAGTGKSTIAQTVAERVFADGLLGASFFCSRDFEDRSDLHFIFPTLAFQLAHKYPDFRAHIVSLLQSNPDVVDESLYAQMERLIVEPLRSADVSTVIVIDALDECRDEEPSSAILSVLGRFVEQIPRVKFFITGRPEPRIKTGFRLPLLVDVTNVFVLHDVHPPLINDDIRLFLKHELSELARRRRLDGWPSDRDLDILCRRASGLFIYAVASVKFLDSKVQLPKRQLEVIAGLPEYTHHEGKTRFNSKTTLDSLYTSIIEAAFSEEGPEVYSKVRSIIGTVVLLVNPLPPSAIAELIGLDSEEVILFLTLVQSLLVFDEDSNRPVKPFHKSFPDFITDPSRCTDTRFYISPGHLHLELTTNTLRVMNDGLEQNLLSLPDYTLNSEVEDLEKRINNRISPALRYACQSWHNHLTKTGGDVIDTVSRIRVFLEEKFLAWLEVVSVLGVTRGAVAALEQLIPWLEEVGRDEELLNTARDCFHFVTKFFEPINISAVHIYHSALELSPLSSIIRRLYYRQRHTPFPKVIAGTPDSWNKSMHLSGVFDYSSYVWSPCGRFVAARTQGTVEIRDPLSSELLSTLTKPGVSLTGELAYSPDGRSLACLSRAALMVWDIQTGGVAKEIEGSAINNVSLMWSLDGTTIGTVLQDRVTHPILQLLDRDTDTDYGVRVYDVALGTTSFPGTLQSTSKPRLWTHDTSFRVMTTRRDDQACTVEISEVGSVLTKIESFRIELWGCDCRITSFSPTTYRISILVHNQLRVLDVRSSERLLKEEDDPKSSHCFSSDGSLFAVSSLGGVHIWKYTSDCYTTWRKFAPQRSSTTSRISPQFSPASSSILGCPTGALQVWHLDGPAVVVYPDSRTPLAVLSRCGTYTATCRRGDSTVTITNLLSQTPSRFINTDMEIDALALTGNVLFVWDGTDLVAWRLTEEGIVDGDFVDKMAGRSDSIWTVPTHDPMFSIEDQTVIIKEGEGNIVLHIYHTGTGEVLDQAQVPSHSCSRQYSPWDMLRGWHYPHYRNSEGRDILPEEDWPVSRPTSQGEWVKGPEGKHRLWIPVEWRAGFSSAHWLYDIMTLCLDHQSGSAIIML